MTDDGQTALHPEATELLADWFGPLDAAGRADEAHARRWWVKDDAFDEELRRRYGRLHAAVMDGERDAWLATPRGRLAFVIVLDQLSRNMFRGTAKMFGGDACALEVAQQGIANGDDRALALDERGFLYMPLMHSEDRANQDESVRLFSAWRDELTGELRDRVAGSVTFAERHRDIVRRFGRFPHRNALLGRASTPEEIAFLSQPGSSF